jgi:hypothetical protein
MHLCFKKSLAALCGLALLCASHPARADMRETLGDTITNMALDLSCDTNEQCKSIGFGDKPCGGFQSYKIYSTKTLDDTTFIKMVNSYNALDKENNLKNQMASTCDMLLQPSVACVQGQCTSAPSNASIH